jgi:hypothetical protein
LLWVFRHTFSHQLFRALTSLFRTIHINLNRLLG